MGLTFYVHPDNAVKLLPPTIELSTMEKAVLDATRSYKSSYMGKDRYQMWTADNGKATASRLEWETAKQALS
jgi:hypothetical protein